MVETSNILARLKTDGWVRIPNVYTGSLIDSVLEEYLELEHEFNKVQMYKGIHDKVKNTTHHSFVLCRKMLDFLDNDLLDSVLNSYFDGPYILNTMGVSRVVKDESIYTENIHRDVRSFTGSANLWLNAIILLTDSTEENGATWFLQGSEKEPTAPSSEEFFKNAVRGCGSKGDVILFDGNMWHCAGKNNTDEPRYIVTPFFSKPFIKQQLDYPRALGIDWGKTLTERLKQVLGYNAMVPVSLEEFYQQDQNRFYKSSQG